MRAVGAVVVRSYIAGLRGRIKELENELRVAEDGDEHAHFHGHEKCTADHGHGGSDHGDEEMEEGHDHGHDHGHGEKCTADHGHHDHGHKEEEHSHDGHDHGHAHKEEEHSHDGHDHGHAHKEEKGHDGHDHGHGHKEEKGHDHGHKHEGEMDEDVPAWKKKALESGSDDPMAAPFGGSWNTESSMDAKSGKN